MHHADSGCRLVLMLSSRTVPVLSLDLDLVVFELLLGKLEDRQDTNGYNRCLTLPMTTLNNVLARFILEGVPDAMPSELKRYAAIRRGDDLRLQVLLGRILEVDRGKFFHKELCIIPALAESEFDYQAIGGCEVKAAPESLTGGLRSADDADSSWQNSYTRAGGITSRLLHHRHRGQESLLRRSRPRC